MKQRILDNGVKILRYKNKILYKNIIKRQINSSNIDFGEKILDFNENRQYGYQPYICNAPYSSLYFGIDGYAYACCKNRSYKLGHIDEKSIKEIWEGEALIHLRENLSELDFELGCQECKKAICASKYANVMAASYDIIHPKKVYKYPKRMDFELSSTCNLACIMCDGYLSSTYRKHFHQLPPNKEFYGEKFLSELDEFIPHLEKANFLGGEPFLIDLYYKIWEKIVHINPKCKIHVQTNGHILNNKVKRLLERGKFSIGVSLESMSKEKYEEIRIYGNYEKMMAHLLYFRDYCKKQNTHFLLAVTPLRSTILELPEIINYANREHIPIYLNTVIEPHDLAIWTLPTVEINQIISQLEEYRPLENDSLSSNNNLQYNSLLNQIKKWAIDSLERDSILEEYDTKYSNEELVQIVIEKSLQYYERNNNDDNSKKIIMREIILSEIPKQLEKYKNNYGEIFRNKLLMLSILDKERVVYELFKNIQLI
jgi:radical SAM protein with 4Fe4S-binding SPASM domain